MKTGMLRRGCAILAIAALCTLVPASPTEAAVREAEIATQATPTASWSFFQFVTQLWSQWVGGDTETGAHIEPDGNT